MADHDLDWTFDHIPSDDAPAPAPPLRPRPPLPTKARRRIPRRWLALSLTFIALVAIGAWLFVRQGWQTIEAQITEAVLYEDEQARAGAVAAVLAAQTPDDKIWLSVRSAETALGWAAALPAAHLLPVDEAPRVDRITALDADLFEVRVTRTYVDSGGLRYEFAVQQRYSNPRPGTWVRLPPDTAAFGETGKWLGKRIYATYPVADQDWMEQALPQVDAALQTACVDWGCASDEVLALDFSVSLSERVSPSLPTRTAASTHDAYPLAFDIRVRQARYPERLVLLSPQVAGQPVDAAASLALIRSLKVEALTAMAAQLTSLTRSSRDFFLDALVARAEQRLGLSPAITAAAPPEGYLPIDQLRRASQNGNLMDLQTGLAFRRQALAFLNVILDGQPASVDGALLRELGTMAGVSRLEVWLNWSLGDASEAALARWEAATEATHSQGTTLATANLDGLIFTCDGGTDLLRGGGRVELPSGHRWFDFGPHAISADGRYIAGIGQSVNSGSSLSSGPTLSIYDFEADQLTTVAEGDWLGLIGWTADNVLLFWQPPEAADDPSSYRLMRYDPERLNAEGDFFALAGFPVAWNSARTQLYLTLESPSPRMDKPGGITRLSGPSAANTQVIVAYAHSPVLSPDELWLALVRYPARVEGMDEIDSDIGLFDLTGQTTTTLVRREDLELETPQGPQEPGRLIVTHWSPDGQRLAFLAIYPAYGWALYTIHVDGSSLQLETLIESEGAYIVPLGFSANSRFLAYHAILPFEQTPGSLATVLRVVDLATRQVIETGGYPSSAVWAPNGPWLAQASSDGLSLWEPASGQKRWVDLGQCSQVAWQPPVTDQPAGEMPLP